MAHTILIIEDDPLSAEFLKLSLQDNGFDTLHAGSCQEARELSEKHQISILVTDIELPDGSGLDLAKELKTTKNIKAIGVTGYDRADINQFDTGKGALEAILTKPIDINNLIQVINKIISST